jgi:hypothetical protein
MGSHSLIPLSAICAKVKISHDVAIEALREVGLGARFSWNSASVPARNLERVTAFLIDLRIKRRNSRRKAGKLLTAPIDRRGPDGEFLHDLLQGWVYFIECESYVRIGYSDTPLRRLEHLRSGNPFPLRLLAIREGNRETEAALHRQWSDLRHHGDWFRRTPELLQFVDTLTRKAGGNTGVIEKIAI